MTIYAKRLPVLLPSVFGLLTIVACDRPPRVSSSFGEYSSPYEDRYDEWVRSSDYVEMRDGVRIAVDVVRPARDGTPIDEPQPVVWTHDRYHRANFGENGVVLSLADISRSARALVRHGYVIVVADVRGGGASFGAYTGAFSPEETRDAYEITEWIAAQPWCDGMIGMFGQSYLGITQFMAASQKHPALQAIFPSMAAFDLYDLVYPGGVYRQDFIETWGRLTRELDTEVPVPPVDGDDGAALLTQALAEHEDNWDVVVEAPKGRFRDSEVDGMQLWYQNNPFAFLREINESGVPIYQWNGWFDIYTRDVFLWFANLEVPQKLTLGPWSHGARDSAMAAEGSRLITVEQLRWFDYWLRGVENGVMNGASINYATTIEPGSWTWHSTSEWPLTNAEEQVYYFSAGRSGSVASTNDGVLSSQPPTAAGEDFYQVDPTTTTGTNTRWDNGTGITMAYPDMRENDAKGLTFTTAPLSEDVNVTGHPVVTAYVTTSSGDADVYALLEEVSPDGVSSYITEGILRVSHRKLADPPFDILGLPYHRSHQEDRVELREGEVAELMFDLYPVSNIFNAGNRIRVTITGADADNTEPPVAASFTILRGPDHPSSIRLPIVH
ncbi:MAG: CocE/NonD family hydrolase [Gemmatimonadota bacterium]|nr:MAG: CocE/NonD family hydrolase [Gemmatimonadota bacterium]